MIAHYMGYVIIKGFASAILATLEQIAASCK
jgi:hypothetical protein